MSSLKKFQVDVGSVDHGNECGIMFESFDMELEPGDIIENYREEIKKEEKFNNKVGLHSTF